MIRSLRTRLGLLTAAIPPVLASMEHHYERGLVPITELAEALAERPRMVKLACRALAADRYVWLEGDLVWLSLEGRKLLEQTRPKAVAR